MLLSKTLKTVALAAVLVATTASGSMAAWMAQDSYLKSNHYNASPNIDWVDEGDNVSIVSTWGNWVKVNPAGPGPHGWVRSYKVTNSNPNVGPGFGFGFGGGGGQACIGGNNGYLCFGN